MTRRGALSPQETAIRDLTKTVSMVIGVTVSLLLCAAVSKLISDNTIVRLVLMIPLMLIAMWTVAPLVMISIGLAVSFLYSLAVHDEKG